MVDVWHAEVDGGTAGGQVLHGLQLLCGGGQRCLDRGGFAEPGLFLGFLECSASLKMLTSPDLSGVLGADVKGPGVAGLCAFVGGGTVPMTDTQRPSR
jgi:hypothetical protein